jgi:hypothetical protein
MDAADTSGMRISGGTETENRGVVLRTAVVLDHSAAGLSSPVHCQALPQLLRLLCSAIIHPHRSGR